MFPESNNYTDRSYIADTENVLGVDNYKKPDFEDFSVIPRVNKLIVEQRTASKLFVFQAFEIFGNLCNPTDIANMVGYYDTEGDKGHFYSMVKYYKTDIGGRLASGVDKMVYDAGDHYKVVGFKPSKNLLLRMVRDDRILNYGPDLVLEQVIYVPIGIVAGMQRLADMQL